MTVQAIAKRAAVLAPVLALAAFSLAACGDKGASTGPGASSPQAAGQSGDDMTIGQPSAPVKVIEYASPSCPHCAKYESDDFPALKAKYIDTGKVYYIFRETPIHPTLDGPAFLLARCVSKDKYFNVIGAIMRGQSEYYAPAVVNAPNADAAVTDAYRAVLMRTAEAEGLTDQKAIACMSDEDSIKKLADRSESEQKQYDVNETPTFVINGVKLKPPEGVEMSNAVVFPAIEQALAKTKH